MYRKGNSLALAVLCACCALAKDLTDIEVLTSNPTRCTYAHAYEMYGAHCVGLRLSSIPYLKGGIEILDFSDNKLQELHSDTFSRYTNLKFLYLAENQIYSIDDKALSSLTDLQTLDLSNNVIFNLPNSIFQLPSLQKLYLGTNPLLQKSLNELDIEKVTAPLDFLDISNSKISKLPEWGILPHLVTYNISHNPLTSLHVKHFAVMCNLRRVDITKSIDDVRACELKQTIIWLQEKHVSFQLDDYSKLNSEEFEKCSISNVSAVYNETYHTCKSQYLQVQERGASRRTWLTVCGGLAGFLVGFILLLYLIHLHNVSKTEGSDLKKAKPVGDKDHNATAALLSHK